MPSPYPTFRELAAICRTQAAEARQPQMADMLLELAEAYDEQAQAEEACRRAA